MRRHRAQDAGEGLLPWDRARWQVLQSESPAKGQQREQHGVRWQCGKGMRTEGTTKIEWHQIKTAPRLVMVGSVASHGFLVGTECDQM